MPTPVSSRYATAAGLQLHYLEAGKGAPVLLLHGWPTSSFLWREVMLPIARTRRVIAVDLPGFGRSDKPLDASYSFRFDARVIDAFLAAIDVGPTGLVVHDLGGPIGLFWAAQRSARVTSLALLNTLVYPRPSWAAVAFIAACRTPGVRDFATSGRGLDLAMRIGVVDTGCLTEAVLDGVKAPFQTKDARRALLKSVLGLHPKGFIELARGLATYEGPVCLAYGERDRILPDVARTMRRVKRDLPQAEVTTFPSCGHFLQEERPAEVGGVLARFFEDALTTR